jgi:hypothetical protein
LLYYRSITIAAKKGELPDMKMLALFGLGTVVLRGAACTMNDLLDIDIDKKVILLVFLFKIQRDCFLLFNRCHCKSFS